MTPLTSNHSHVQNMSSHGTATSVYPIMQQTYQSQQPVPIVCSTAVTPRHQNVVAQLQQLQMQQQQQQPQQQQQLDYYNVSSQQQQQQPKQQQQQRRRQVSRDSSRWSLLDEDDAGDRDDCGDQVQ